MAYISFQPSDFFNTKLFTGTNLEHAITGVGFQPALIWGRQRTDSGANYLNADAAQGVTKYLQSNVTTAQVTNAESVKSFDADGFTLGTASQINESAKTIVTWNWRGGTTSGITTDGSTTITPSAYSFNQTSGFSALAYTGNSTSGAKLAHGLGVAPEMVIIKNLGTLNDWVTYSKYVKATDPEDWVMRLNNSSAAVDDVSMWNDTQPDSVNITLGNAGNVNTGYSYTAYCFAPVKGYSKLGSYIANGDADGTFVYTGFQPAYVLIKSIISVPHWNIFDSTRTPYNPENPLWADTTGSESSIGSYNVDLLSNGFKVRTSSSQVNSTSYDPYTYMACAEFPLVSSNSKPAVAR